MAFGCCHWCTFTKGSTGWRHLSTSARLLCARRARRTTRPMGSWNANMRLLPTRCEPCKVCRAVPTVLIDVGAGYCLCCKHLVTRQSPSPAQRLPSWNCLGPAPILTMVPTPHTGQLADYNLLLDRARVHREVSRDAQPNIWRTAQRAVHLPARPTY